jgi:hypothetical protein
MTIFQSGRSIDTCLPESKVRSPPRFWPSGLSILKLSFLPYDNLPELVIYKHLSSLICDSAFTSGILPLNLINSPVSPFSINDRDLLRYSRLRRFQFSTFTLLQNTFSQIPQIPATCPPQIKGPRLLRDFSLRPSGDSTPLHLLATKAFHPEYMIC